MKASVVNCPLKYDGVRTRTASAPARPRPAAGVDRALRGLAAGSGDQQSIRRNPLPRGSDQPFRLVVVDQRRFPVSTPAPPTRRRDVVIRAIDDFRARARRSGQVRRPRRTASGSAHIQPVMVMCLVRSGLRRASGLRRPNSSHDGGGLSIIRGRCPAVPTDVGHHRAVAGHRRVRASGAADWQPGARGRWPRRRSPSERTLLTIEAIFGPHCGPNR